MHRNAFTFQSVRRTQLEQHPQVMVARVHHAVAHEPDQMQRPVALTRMLDRTEQRCILLKLTVLDRLVDPAHVLINHAARAQVLSLIHI